MKVVNLYIAIKVFFYSPTDAQVNCLKNNFEIYIKIDIKTAELFSLLPNSATYTHQQGPTNIRNHITTHRCILIG